MTEPASATEPRATAPRVFVVAGPPGSGKSTFGAALARSWPAVLLDQDTLTNPLMSRIGELVGGGDDLDHPAFRGPVRQARLDCVLGAARDNLGLGWSVVLVAPFTAELADPSRFRQVFGSLAGNAAVQLIWVTVPEDVARERRRARGLSRDLAADLGAPRTPAVPTVAFVEVNGAAESAVEVRRVRALVS